MFSGCVDAGLVLALPFHHRDLEPDCVEVSTRGVGGGWGLMRGIKIPPQDFGLKMQGGLMREGGGAYLRDTMVIGSQLVSVPNQSHAAWVTFMLICVSYDCALYW